MLAVKNGDRAAFAAIIDRHQQAVVRFAARFLGQIDHQAAEDVAQDVFINLWKAAPRYQPSAKTLTYIFRITKNHCLNLQRRQKLRKFLPLIHARDTSITDDPTTPSDATETEDAVRRALTDLPPKQRSALILRHFHDLPYQEIADILETSVSAIESLLFRARTTLRTTLAPVGDSRKPPQVSQLVRVEP
jgi:RNA polymerase sigma-70 factor (ECF subfamily)